MTRAASITGPAPTQALSLVNKVGALDRLARQINSVHAVAHDDARRAIEGAVQCGHLLIEARRKVDHGGWLPWIENNLKFGARQAQKYMRLAERAGELPNAN